MKLCREITGRDRWIVLTNAAAKILRGLFCRIGMREVHGLLFAGANVRITHKHHIRCGKNVKFEENAEIQGLCRGGLKFGDGATIGRNTMIRPSSYYGVDLGSGLEIGKNSSIGAYSYVGCSGKIVIGDHVMIGPRCSLFAENHVFADTGRTIQSQGVRQKGIAIQDDCWIGSGCIILDGVTIGKGCVIGAGTLISRDVPANSVVTDRRDTRIKKRTE